MATGRGYLSIPHFEGVDFDIWLTFNGSYVRSKDTVLFKNPLDADDKHRILQNLKQMHRAAAISNEHFIVTNGTDPDLAQYFSFGSEKLVISEHFDALCEEEIYQIMCSCNSTEYAQILQGTHATQITAWWDKAVDIIPLSCGKGNAVRAVLAHYGFSKSEAIAFGDGRNDIEMLEESVQALPWETRSRRSRPELPSAAALWKRTGSIITALKTTLSEGDFLLCCVPSRKNTKGLLHRAVQQTF